MIVISNVALETEKINKQVDIIPFASYKDDPRAADATMFVGFPGDITEAFLDACPSLKLVQVLPAGFEGLPVSFQELKRRGIQFAYGRSVCHKAIAESAVMLLLMFAKRFKEAVINQTQKKWAPLTEDIIEVAGKTVAVLGCGSIGGEVARRLHEGFEMKVVGYAAHPGDRAYFDAVYTGMDGFKQAIAQADYIVSCLPMTAQTKHIINKDTLSLMKKNCVFINIGRGGLVNEAELIQALQSGVIAGAGLDVFEKEPLPSDSPLWDMDNVIISAHGAGYSDMTAIRKMQVMVDNINALCEGKPLLNVLNDTDLYEKK